MNRDEIILMAQEAGFSAKQSEIYFDRMLQRFAALVAAAEREASAYRASIALLGAERGLSNRVDQAIRARGQDAHT